MSKVKFVFEIRLELATDDLSSQPCQDGTVAPYQVTQGRPCISLKSSLGDDPVTFEGGGVMAWLTLLAAGLFEIGWAVGLKAANGRPLVLAATIVAMIVSVALLYLAMRDLPLGTAYAVWTGIGAVGTVLVGNVAFGESADAVRLLCIGLIVAGIAGLKFVTP